MYIFNIIYIYTHTHTDMYNNAVNQNKLSIRKITTTLKCQYMSLRQNKSCKICTVYTDKTVT